MVVRQVFLEAHEALDQKKIRDRTSRVVGVL